MRTNEEKAKAIISLLGDRSKDILSLLSPEAAQALSGSVGSRTTFSPTEAAALVQEMEQEIHRIKFGGPEQTNTATKDKKEADPFFSDLEDDDLLNDNKLEIEDDIDPIPPRDKSLRSPEKIASLLEKEKVQITAFLLSRVDEEERNAVLQALNADYRQKVESATVDDIPLSDAVFNNIYEKIFKKTVEESLEEDGDDLSF